MSWSSLVLAEELAALSTAPTVASGTLVTSSQLLATTSFSLAVTVSLRPLPQSTVSTLPDLSEQASQRREDDS